MVTKGSNQAERARATVPHEMGALCVVVPIGCLTVQRRQKQNEKRPVRKWPNASSSGLNVWKHNNEDAGRGNGRQY